MALDGTRWHSMALDGTCLGHLDAGQLERLQAPAETMGGRGGSCERGGNRLGWRAERMMRRVEEHGQG